MIRVPNTPGHEGENMNPFEQFREVLDDAIDLYDALAELKSRYGSAILGIVADFAEVEEDLSEEEFQDRLAKALQGAGGLIRSAVFLALFQVAVATTRGLRAGAAEVATSSGIPLHLIIELATRLATASDSSTDFADHEISSMLAGIRTGMRAQHR